MPTVVVTYDMKAPSPLSIFLLATCISCSVGMTENPNEQVAMDIFAIDAKFPLRLSKIDLGNKDNAVHLNDEIKSTIEQVIKDYYKNACVNDSLHTYKDTYVTTIRLQDSIQTIFFVLLKNYPTGELNSRILFFNNSKKEFAHQIFDFRIYALFDFEDHQLKPSSFKTEFKIDTPEIQLVDFDKDGINDYKFTRLFHNGTFNSIKTIVLTIKNSRLDTLNFDEKGLGKWTYK